MHVEEIQFLLQICQVRGVLRCHNCSILGFQVFNFSVNHFSISIHRNQGKRQFVFQFFFVWTLYRDQCWVAKCRQPIYGPYRCPRIPLQHFDVHFLWIILFLKQIMHDRSWSLVRKLYLSIYSRVFFELEAGPSMFGVTNLRTFRHGHTVCQKLRFHEKLRFAVQLFEFIWVFHWSLDFKP